MCGRSGVAEGRWKINRGAHNSSYATAQQTPFPFPSSQKQKRRQKVFYSQGNSTMGAGPLGE